MSRRAPAGRPAAEEGYVYTAALWPWLRPEPPGDSGHQVGHYTGFAPRDRLEERLAVQARGGPDAARLLQVQKARGGTWRLVALEWATRDRETQLKERGASRRCPACATGHDPAADPEAGMGWAYLLHREPQAQATGEEHQAHCVGFTVSTGNLIAATKRGGRAAASQLQAPDARGGTLRLVWAQWGPRDHVMRLAERAARRACPVCAAVSVKAQASELLAAIGRGEVADREHPRFGWAARWHTLDGRPLRSSDGHGGELGRSVTAAVATLVRRGLAERAAGTAPGADRPYRLTPDGAAALRAARERPGRAGQRADGLPANRNGTLSRSRTRDDQKAAAGVMTSAQRAAHTTLRKLDQPRPAERLTGPLPDDQWTTPALLPGPPARLPRGPDPSWPSAVRDGIAAAARRDAAAPRRPVPRASPHATPGRRR
jgi:hypothetical protein